MIEYLRARQQQQAMPQRQQMQFGMPPRGANGNASFPHDPSQAIPNSQSHMGGAPSNPNYMQMQALRQNQMFAQNQGGQFNRQLNLMLQQNQESQNVASNNPMSLLQRLGLGRPRHSQRTLSTSLATTPCPFTLSTSSSQA